MRHALFSTESKTCSISPLQVLTAAFLTLFLWSCTAAPPRRPLSESPIAEQSIQVDAQPHRVKRQIPVPPWQLWSVVRADAPEIEQAEELAGSGDLEAAAAAYERIEQTAADPALREEALLRRSGTLLKLGQSSRALSAITAALSGAADPAAAMPPSLAVVTAFAYLQQRNVDQALAWLGVALKNANGTGEAAVRARAEAAKIIRSLDPSQFQDFKERWTADALVGPLFAAEELRRARGAAPQPLQVAHYFDPQSYQPGYIEVALEPPVSGELLGGAQQPAMFSSEGELVLGLLLPLSGQFAVHGERVKRGVELAVQQAQARGDFVRVIVGDTQGEPAAAVSEYERLVLDEKVSMVLGPLLVRTSEAVADRSRELGVPFMTFTKRSGIPELAPTVLRLGATAEDQVLELVGFAQDNLGITTYSILYPDTESGRELAGSFSAEVVRRGGLIFDTVGYLPGNRDSAEQAVDSLRQNVPQAVFVGDSLESAFPIIEALRRAEDNYGEEVPAESLEQVRAKLRDSMLLGPAAWDDMVAIQGLGKLLEGATYVTPFFAQSEDPQVAAFATLYRDNYREQPGLLSAQGYDAANLLIERLPATTAGAKNIINFLKGADNTYIGVTGSLSVEDSGNVARRMSVVRVISGEPMEVFSKGAVTSYVVEQQEAQVSYTP